MEDQYYDIERRTAIKEEARLFRRKFLTYEQAEVIYSISHRKLRDLAGAAAVFFNGRPDKGDHADLDESFGEKGALSILPICI